jgi:hypothetical protein
VGPATAGSAASASLAAAVFSAPIAAARAAQVDVVAGLVASEGVVRVMGVGNGAPTWSADALRDVSWAPDAELRLQATPTGLALVWRGPHAGKTARTMVLLGPRGEPLGGSEIGSAFCVTADGLAWIDPRASGPARVLARRWSDPAPHEVASVSPDRDPALVCGDHVAVVVGDGDDDVTAAAFMPGDSAAPAPTVVVRDADFGDDDEREHDAYSVGDDLGLVRVASSGALAMRELSRTGGATAWRKLKHTLAADDDVVAVDGDADSTLVVFTRDADDACPGIGSTAVSVRALRIDRKSGVESLLDLAPADCERSPGPFWIAPSPAGPTIAWVERTTKLPPKAAAIAGAAFRLVGADGVRAGRIDQRADALVDGGCDARGCSVAALLRPPDGDGMQPEPIGVFTYP